jgi:uncharacterized coiled-coil protein SlyX
MRCDFCKEEETDGKYCRKCGKLLNISPKSSAEKLADEHNTPDKAVNSNSTSVLGVDFSQQAPGKQVVPFKKGDSSSASGHPLRSKLQTILLSVAGFLLVSQLAVTVTMFIWVWKLKQTPQPQPAQAQTRVGDDVVQTPSAPSPTGEKLTSAPAEEVASSSETKEAIEKLNQELILKRQTKEKLDQELAELSKAVADKKSNLKKLNQMLALVTDRLNELNTEIASKEGRLRDLQTEIASAEATLNKLNAKNARAKVKNREYRIVVAQLPRKKAEVAQLQREISGLREEASQRRLTVRGLQKQIDSIKYADHVSRKRRTLLKG